MTQRTCANGHHFQKTSSCPVCPICSKDEMEAKYAGEFPHLGAPAYRALDAAGITHLLQLSVWTEKELLALHGFGPASIAPLKKALSQIGLTFAS